MITFIKNYFVVFALLTLFLATNWAILRQDFFRVHDFTQGARVVEMATALKDGHFPALWSENLGYGYGMPLFEFYAPLPFYISALFYLLGFSLISSVKMLYIIPAIFTIWGSYLLGKKLFGTLGGIIVSSVITLFPYRAVNLYIRGALSEIWGMMTLPFILLGLIKTVRKEKYGWIILVFSIVTLLISHNLTALMFLPFSIVFGAIYLLVEYFKKQWKLQELFFQVFHLASYYFLAFCISAFYTIPAFLEKGFTRLESTILAEYFDFRLHFVYLRQFFTENWGFGGSTYGPLDDISFYLGFGQLIGLFFLLFLFSKKLIKSCKKSQHKKLLKDSILFFTVIVIFLLSLLLTTAKTQFIWENIQILSFLQFPWRFLSVVAIFLGLSLGYISVYAPNKLFKMIYTWVLFFVLVIGNFLYFQPEKFISQSEASQYYYSESNRLRSEMSDTLPDYIPIQVPHTKIRPIAYSEDIFSCDITDTCGFTYSMITNKVQKKQFLASTEFETPVVFTVADFPGWQVSIDGIKATHSFTEDGFITFVLPSGEHMIDLELRSTPIRRNANSLSIFGLLAFGGIYLVQSRKYRNE